MQLGPGGHEFESFLVFLLFFGPHGFAVKEGRTPLIARAIKGSSEYSLGVGEALKERVFEALRLCIEGFIAFSPNGLKADSDLKDCQENGLVLLYRLLFIMFAEGSRASAVSDQLDVQEKSLPGASPRRSSEQAG